MRRVLGHATRWVEEKQVAPIKIAAICPGGIVRVWVPENPDRTQVDLPDRIVVVYTPDADKAPENVNATPDSILGQGGFSATVQVPPTGGLLTAKVPGIKSGGYDVQLILEWDDVPDGSTRMGLVARGDKTM